MRSVALEEAPWSEPPMEEYLRGAAEFIAIIAEICGIAVVAVAIVRAIVHFVRDLIRHEENIHRTTVRLHLGRSLALSLEFLLAADVVRTAVAPSWEEIGKLAAIATIRTALNFFLQREIEHEQHVERARTGGGAGES